MATTTFVDGVTLSASSWANDVDVAAYPVLTSVAGTDTITATGPANYSLSASRAPLILIPANTNTGATTLAITPSGGSVLTAKNVFCGGAALSGGEFVAGVPAIIEYDGTQYNILGGPAITYGTVSTTWTFDGTGGTSGAITLTWLKVWKTVTVHIPAVTATSGTSSTSLTNNTVLPANIRPTNFQHAGTPRIINNGAVVADTGVIGVASTGVITIARDSVLTAFTNSASAGTSQGTTIHYFLG